MISFDSKVFNSQSCKLFRKFFENYVFKCTEASVQNSRVTYLSKTNPNVIKFESLFSVTYAQETTYQKM